MIARLITAMAFFGMLMSAAPQVSAADKIDDVKETADAFDAGMALLKKGDYDGASSAFRDLISRYPQSKNLDIFLYNAGRADLHRRQHADAAAAFGKLIDQFPENDLKPYAEYFLGNARYGLADVNGALEAWITAWRDTKEERLQKLILGSLTGALNASSDVQLNKGMFVVLGDEQRCQLSRRILADIPAAKTALRDQLNALCGETAAPTTSTSKTTTTPKVLYNIAVLLPFSGEFQSFGQQIMQGATVAADETAAKTEIGFQFVPYDTKGDPITAGRLLKTIDSSNAIAAIGPLTSDEAAVVSAALSALKLPVLIPAATDASITSLSSTSFQLSANVELQGAAIAEYARLIVKADSAAILTSGEASIQPMVDAFEKRFGFFGGTVVATEVYRTRDRDFGPYFTDLKAMILGYRADSIWYINAKGDTLDAEGVPAHIDCLFMPGGATQLRQLLPQLRFYGIDAALLGSDGWGDTLVYGMGDDVTKLAVFPSPFIIQENTEAFTTFSGLYQKKFGAKPSRLACLGYDALKLIADAAANGNATREGLVKYLSLRSEYSGAAGMISFGNLRENTAMPLYRIQGGRAVPLSTSTSTNR
jgi:branched-chain amino acid transport system substrate-binding protein